MTMNDEHPDQKFMLAIPRFVGAAPFILHASGIAAEVAISQPGLAALIVSYPTRGVGNRIHAKPACGLYIWEGTLFTAKELVEGWRGKLRPMLWEELALMTDGVSSPWASAFRAADPS